MNISSMINSLSEETIISAAVFIGAGLIYILRKFSFLNQRISEYELADAMGKESLQRDLLIMNELEDEIRSEFKITRDNVEEELVQHELIGLEMAPKFQTLGKKIADILDEQSDSIIDIDNNVSSINTRISRISNMNSEISLFILFATRIPTFKDSVISVKNSFEDKADFFLINSNMLESKIIYLFDSFNHTIESSSEIF